MHLQAPSSATATATDSFSPFQLIIKMDAAELRTYEQQLNQVRTALEADPANDELRNLEEELQKIIDLNKELTQNASSSSSSTPAIINTKEEKPSNGHLEHKFIAGEDCQAKYESDGRWYPARIVSISGSNQNPIYTILFKGYNETAIVQASSLRPIVSKVNHHTPSSSNNKSVPTLTPEQELERERKRKRSEKKNERFANRTAEAQAVQNSWQKFAKKAEKKGHLKKEKNSMFKTPDDPLAKVGVIGAGRGMTQYGDRKKHTYEDEDK